ncbi:hypothetical protein GRF29_28g95482 [Pseudopithomyces chartarum]|uniref:NAD(P)-binding domain-containing protein n=1 Tax=Pseudopithomyces chartarum TaxID=1892770 RepID=A0AAN6RIE0_9PLEO|nr:hypothetical protein GRF29_28g95482 [Pseudopithomyces chartarum]
MELKNIAILGARGNVGTSIITALLASPTPYTILALSRSTTSIPYIPPHSSITPKSIDYTSFDALKDAFTGQDMVINCVTGCATQYEPSKLIIDAAIAANVPFYFSNEFVGNIFSEQFGRLPEVAAGAKLRIRRYLEGVGEEGKISWMALNGGPFFEMCEFYEGRERRSTDEM